MNIIISENLKELRKNKNNTQEDLAEFLTVSINAVSKWERGECCPDIELLPKIASYYDVSVDDLLGVGEIRKRERINEYKEKSSHFQAIGDMKSHLELWREAQKEFPNDWDVLFNLMYSLYWGRKQEYRQEAIQIGEKLLAESTRTSDKTSAIQVLCYIYDELGDLEKAKEYAYMASNFSVSQERLLSNVLKGEELILHSQRYILDSAEFLAREIFAYASYPTGITDDSKKQIYHKALKIYELIYEEGDFGFYTCRLSDIYVKLAEISAKQQNKDETLDCLANAVKYVIMHDTQGDFERKSLLVNRIPNNTKNVSKSYMSNDSYLRLKEIEDKRYDFCRDDERFIKLTEDLKKVAVSG